MDLGGIFKEAVRRVSMANFSEVEQANEAGRENSTGDADPGSVAIEMSREAAVSPMLRNRASLDAESHSQKKPLCQASVSPFCQA
ncbi:hypothetical protein Baya_3324 [Bagarius yarrelli]|uniref:Uncharacterized protein n=1 Tax=Bagarius yarrelli TaxID=175774 RepID=A0A556TSA4_BAGYA|nr:hypothetical protein Baya_3324 [Bagarius yarrelli]